MAELVHRQHRLPPRAPPVLAYPELPPDPLSRPVSGPVHGRHTRGSAAGEFGTEVHPLGYACATDHLSGRISRAAAAGALRLKRLRPGGLPGLKSPPPGPPA